MRVRVHALGLLVLDGLDAVLTVLRRVQLRVGSKKEAGTGQLVSEEQIFKVELQNQGKLG